MDTQLDPQVVNLAKAIRQTESGGDFNAKGASGEHGAYQFTNDTWNGASAKYGINVPLNKATPEQQNAVAYNQIKEWKDAGHNVAQIASMWNAGQGEPEAYTGKFSNGKSSTGTNKFGVKYSVPDYAYSVANAYQTLKQGEQVNADQNNPSSTASAQNQPASVGGFIQNTFSSAGKVLSGLGQAVMHPIDTVSNVVSTAAGGVEKLFGANNQDTQNFDNLVNTYKERYGGSSIGEVVQNIGHTLYTDPIGAALDLSVVLDGAGAALGRIGKISDVSKATELAKTSDFISTTKGILDSGSPEAIKVLQTPGTMTKIADAVKTVADYTNPMKPVAGAVSGAFQGIAKLTEALPRRIINNLLPQLKNADTIDYATSNLKLGSIDSMLGKSEASLNLYDTSIKSILNHPDYAGVSVSGSEIVQKTLGQFKNSEYTPASVIAKIKSQIPGTSALVTKLEKGTLSLDEANTLRQAIDKVTYKTIIDSPEVRAGKELAQAFGNSIRTEVKTLAPETVPIFDKYSKEINLNKALNKLAAKSGKASAVSMKELLAALGATGLVGPVGGLGVLAAEKLASTPAARVGVAKVLKNTAVPVAKGVATGVTKTAPFIKEAAMAGRVSNSTQPPK